MEHAARRLIPESEGLGVEGKEISSMGSLACPSLWGCFESEHWLHSVWP